MKLLANLIGGMLYIVVSLNWFIYHIQPDNFTILTVLLLAFIAFQHDKKKE